MNDSKPTIPSGFITLARVILSKDEFQEDAPLSKRDAYIELMLMASYTEQTATNGGEQIELHRGQLLVSEKDLMARFRWGNTKVRNFLKWLEDEGIATIDKAVCKAGSKAVRKAVLTLVDYGFASYRKAVDKVVDKAVDKAVPGKERKEAKESKGYILSNATHSSEYREINNITLNADFEQFWAAYPRKVSKQTALASYTKARQTVTAETIMAGVDRYTKWIAAVHQEAQYIAHPSTWLNQRRWEDEYPVTAEQPTVKKTGFHNFPERHTDYDALFGKR